MIEDMIRLERLAGAVKNRALCGLGAGAPNPVLITIRYFRPEYKEHINHGRCPSLAGKSLIVLLADSDRCKGCGICADICPVGTITGEGREARAIDQAGCIRCGACASCPSKFSAIVHRSGALEVAQ